MGSSGGVKVGMRQVARNPCYDERFANALMLVESK